MERSEEFPARGSAASVRLAELYQRHAPRAEALARLLCGDAQAAQDIAQEAFVRSAGRLTGLRDPGAFEAYLRRTVVNLCRARHRRLAVERRYLGRMVEVPAASADSGYEDTSEDRDVLWTALGQLPERQRAAIVLRYYEDLSEDQVADILRCSPRAVNSLVSRAMTALRLRVAAEEEEGT